MITATSAPIADRPEEIKIWGRRRLFALARVLPLCDRIEVRLLGTGMPSIWVAHMGEMRLSLALSGWTANDWTSGANLELLAGGAAPDVRAMTALTTRLHEVQRASSEELAQAVGISQPSALASLHELAKHGQAVYDFSSDCYRYREVMPFALSEAVLGPDHPELTEGRRIARTAGGVKVIREEALPGGRRLFVFKALDTSSEAVVDADGAFKSGKCTCSFFFKNRLRSGPCRHLVALKLSTGLVAVAPPPPAPAPVAPAPAATAPAAKGRGPVRREEVISFAKDILAEVRTRADDEDKGISEIVEEAWDQAFERMQACKGWKDAVKLADPGHVGGDPRTPSRVDAVSGRSVSSPVQQTVMLHEEVLREITLVADRFGASPSATVNLAWLVARSRSRGRA